MTRTKETEFICMRSLEDIDKQEDTIRDGMRDLAREVICCFPRSCLSFTKTGYRLAHSGEINYTTTNQLNIADKRDPYTSLARISNQGKRWVYSSSSNKTYYGISHKDIKLKGSEKKSTNIKAIIKVLNNLKVHEQFTESYTAKGHTSFMSYLNDYKRVMHSRLNGESYYNNGVDIEEIHNMIQHGYKPVTATFKEAFERYYTHYENNEKARVWSPAIYHVFKNVVTDRYTVTRATLKTGSDSMNLFINLQNPETICERVIEKDIPEIIFDRMSVIDMGIDMDVANDSARVTESKYYEGTGMREKPNRWWIILDE